jgi:hypothetical protein
MAETQTVIQREAPEIEAYKLGLMEQAKALAESAPTLVQLRRLTPEQLGLSPLQFQALEQLATQTEGGIGGYKPFLEEAGQTLGRAEDAGALSTGIFDPSMVDQFMNPYQKAVTEQALSQLNKQFAEQQAQRGASAVGAGAFGGARTGVVEGIAQRELGDVASRRIFEDLARNFGQAQQSAMTSFENQQRRQANQAGLLSNLATQIQTLTGPPQQQVPLFQQALGAGITGLGLYGAGSKLGIF